MNSSLRRSHFLGASVAAIVAVAPGSEAFAEGETLAAVAVRPHTNDDDKDSDTRLGFRVYHGSDDVAVIHNIVGHFDDHTWNGPFALELTDAGRAIRLDQVDELVCNVHIDPNGHDTWKFDYHIRYTFSGGTAVYRKHDGCWLSQDNRDNDFGSGHIDVIDDPDKW